MANKKIEKALPLQRYSYTLERLIKSDEIYVLIEEDNKYAVSEFEDKLLLSFWPTEEIALKNAKNTWEGFSAKKLSVEDMELVIDAVEDNNWLMDFFPIDSKTGTIVTVEEFIADLNKMYKEMER